LNKVQIAVLDPLKRSKIQGIVVGNPRSEFYLLLSMPLTRAKSRLHSPSYEPALQCDRATIASLIVPTDAAPWDRQILTSCPGFVSNKQIIGQAECSGKFARSLPTSRRAVRYRPIARLHPKRRITFEDERVAD